MRAIVVMFDSLNRRMLSCYGGDAITPNFARLSARCTTFDRSYVGSMPCMPARREMHTGRYNLLHRSWGPMEPFDDSMPNLLHRAGVHTHLVSDHYHYWEEGGGNYHTKYTTWEIVRGQEGDPWKGVVGGVSHPDFLPPSQKDLTGTRREKIQKQDWVNRTYMPDEASHSQTGVFDLGLEFLETNRDKDDWFLQIECFDPHEPFYTFEHYLSLYEQGYEGLFFDWPMGGRDWYPAAEAEHARNCYKALVTMCDHSLGRVLDFMDTHAMWEDTMLVVCTDHGFLLGEHGYWAKNIPPYYNEIANTPLFLHDPRRPTPGARREALVQLIDLPPTLLNFFGQPVPPDMLGHDLAPVLECDTPVREALLFGAHSQYLNCTDGRYLYMCAPRHREGDSEYTLMPEHMTEAFSVELLRNATLHPGFSFTKGCPVLRVPRQFHQMDEGAADLFFDLEADPGQNHPIDDAAALAALKEKMVRVMGENDAPTEQYDMYGLREAVPC